MKSFKVKEIPTTTEFKTRLFCKQRISQKQFSRIFHFDKHYHYPLCPVADSSDTLLEQFLSSFTVCINRGNFLWIAAS